MGRISLWRQRQALSRIFKKHFSSDNLAGMIVAERKFPARLRPDLQRALDELFKDRTKVRHFTSILAQRHDALSVAILAANPDAMSPAAPLYEEIEIGEESPARCLQNGLWLATEGNVNYVMLMARSDSPPFGDGSLRVQIGVIGAVGMEIVEKLFGRLNDVVRSSRCYRGKVLSLDEVSRYTGESQGVKVHKLRTVAREEVILPRKTLELLERNVLRFVERRENLGKFGQSRKKGLLFYGPPGTGKTHTIHYLAGALKGHTTLLISAEQVGLLSEYMTLARLLQPSMVIIEDADLIARERAQMQSVCEEVLLNKLLNEMDGLKEDAEVLFILTTNRPETLEAALTARPGRIDQAIEFPLPDDEGRRKLLALYSRGMKLDETISQEILKRTAGVSGAFIKELMRRSVQFHLEKNQNGQ
ncbi:MAG TPA: ATP-binding protein, partial [Phycisphaerae bacterium]